MVQGLMPELFWGWLDFWGRSIAGVVAVGCGSSGSVEGRSTAGGGTGGEAEG